MKRKGRYLLLFILAIVIAAFGEYAALYDDREPYLDSAADNRILILIKSGALVDHKNKIFIANKAPAMEEISGDIYALSYDGLLIYSLKNNSVKIYRGHGNGVEGIFWVKKPGIAGYDQHPASITEINRYDEFSTQEKENFDKMLAHTGDPLWPPIYAKPYYASSYDQSLIDTERLIYLTAYKRGSLQGEKLYIYGGNNFTLLDISSGSILQYYNELLGKGVPAHEELKKENYGSKITFAASFKIFTTEDQAVFRTLREQNLRNDRLEISQDERNKYLAIDLSAL